MNTNTITTKSCGFFTIALILLLNLNVQAQNSNNGKTRNTWFTFTSIDKSFSIELPEVPKGETKLPKPKNLQGGDVDLTFFRCTRSEAIYSLPSISPGVDRFSITEVDVSDCSRDPSEFDKEVDIIVAFAGGDNRMLLKDKVVTVSGLNARDIVYQNGTRILRRTLFVRGNTKIFLLTYDRMAGATSEEERIFCSFNPFQ